MLEYKGVWKQKKKKYKVYIEWWTEVEASSVEEAIEKGSDDWFFDHDHKNFVAEEIKWKQKEKWQKKNYQL